MKEKTLRWIIYIAGVFCLYVFISIRFFSAMNTLLSDKMDPESSDFNKHGDLYYFGCIADFKEPYPQKIRNYRYSDKQPKLNEADILSFGDSFFDFSFEKTLPERLSDTLGEKVYSYVTYDPTKANPFCILDADNYQKTSTPRYMIFETVERNIPVRFAEPYDPLCNKEKENFKTRLYGFLDKYVFKKNTEPLYGVLLKQSIFTKRIYAAISTIRFDLTGYITSLTPVYKTGKKPWLFYYKQIVDEPGSFYYHYTKKEIDTYCDNISKLAKNLKSVYNLDMILVPVPNKYTIYHKVVNNDKYNNFLPELQEGLRERGVNFVDLYDPYKNSPDTLYFGTDTHWNKKGVDIALHKIMNKLNQNN